MLEIKSSVLHGRADLPGIILMMDNQLLLNYCCLMVEFEFAYNFIISVRFMILPIIGKLYKLL
jgi:hypothetical protein